MATIKGISAGTPLPEVHERHASTPSSAQAAFSLPLRPLAATSGTAAQIGGNASSHLPVAGRTPGKGAHDIQETVLKLHAYRLELIASNIANADTPNYKAVDIDFREALRLAKSSAAPSGLDVNSATHFQAQGPNSPLSFPVRYAVAQQPGVDGNTVELEAERAKFAGTALRYEFSLNRVSGHYKMMMELLTNLKD